MSTDAPTPAQPPGAPADPPVVPGLPFTAPWLLAPMEGVTEPCFRELVLERNPPTALGGAFTEFVRVVEEPLPRKTLRSHLGERRFGAPVGLQLMGARTEHVATTAARAVEVGAPLIDLNFGCPAKGALRGCAGSAVLRDPPALERTVRACVEAVAPTPVTAKIRAGYDDARDLETLARAAEQGGAALLTVHCRTRAEGYCEAVDWSRIARAVSSVDIPVCGNGGIQTHADLERMRRECGCAFAMVGRGALADPWIFTGSTVSQRDAATFLLQYAHLLHSRAKPGHKSPKARATARVKQLLGHWTAGGLLGDEPEAVRRDWLRADQTELFSRLNAFFEDVQPARAEVR